MKKQDQLKVIDLTAYLVRKRHEEKIKSDEKTDNFITIKQNLQRRQLIAKVKMAQKELGINDSDYRALLRADFGVSSCTALDDQGLVRLAAFLRSKGWTDRSAPAQDHDGRPMTLSSGEASPITPVLKKIEALLSELGKVKGEYVPWNYAEAILEHQTGRSCLDAANVKSLCHVVAALNHTLKSARRKAECKTR